MALVKSARIERVYTLISVAATLTYALLKIPASSRALSFDGVTPKEIAAFSVEIIFREPKKVISSDCKLCDTCCGIQNTAVPFLLQNLET
jgi:hypothetical protein